MSLTNLKLTHKGFSKVTSTVDPKTGVEIYSCDISDVYRHEDFPSIVSTILFKCPTAMVAGGYLRDVCTDLQPHDIDIFLVGQPEDRAADYDKIFRILRTAGYALTANHYVDTWSREGDLEIQVIHGRTEETYGELLASFDWICNQIGAIYSHAGQTYELIYTEKALYQSQHRILEYNARATNQFHGRQIKRLLKLARNRFTADYKSLVPLFSQMVVAARKDPVKYFEDAFSDKPGYIKEYATEDSAMEDVHPADRINEKAAPLD